MKTLTEKEFYDKVYGCWLGKNVGGTLGGPVEGKMELLNLDFYPCDFNGEPMENDDLDLQLLNLHAVEQYGVQLNADHLVQEWLAHVFFNMDEYGLFTENARRGLKAPIAGVYNNKFTHCMGSPIRSEIWAVLAAGMPQVAAYYAYQDAVIDHAGGEGVYGEVFLAVLESLAFYESDVLTLIEQALLYIPKQSVTARAILDILDLHRKGLTWQQARQELINRYGTDNFCYAPLNLAFMVLGLFYGRNFSERLLITVNCGYDTDCTAATVGAILGILGGAKAIDEKWIAPIGDGIKVSPQVTGFNAPKNLSELTERSVKAHRILKAYFENCSDRSIFAVDPDIYTVKYTLPAGSATGWDLQITQQYGEQDPTIAPGGERTVTFTVKNCRTDAYKGALYLQLPSGFLGNKRQEIYLQPGQSCQYSVTLKNGAEPQSSYPCALCVEQFVKNLLWQTQKIEFFLLPTKNWLVAQNGGSPQALCCPGDRIAFEKAFAPAAGDLLTAETELYLPQGGEFRLMVHTRQRATLFVDGQKIFEKQGAPYLPAFHRPCPDANLVLTAGGHRLKIAVSVEKSGAEPVAFQIVAAPKVFANRPLLLPQVGALFNLPKQ